MSAAASARPLGQSAGVEERVLVGDVRGWTAGCDDAERAGDAHAEGDGLAVVEAGAEPGQSFQGMSHRVSVVEDGTPARLALVAGDDLGLERAAAADQVDERVAVALQRCLQPAVDDVGQPTAADHRGFHDLGER